MSDIPINTIVQHYVCRIFQDTARKAVLARPVLQPFATRLQINRVFGPLVRNTLKPEQLQI